MGCGASKDPARPDAVQMQKAQGAFEAGTLETNKAPTTVATSLSSGNAHRDPDWARTIEKWAVKETDASERPNAAEAALADAAAACVSAGSSPCANCSNAFAEQWGDAPWHCFECKQEAARRRSTQRARGDCEEGPRRCRRAENATRGFFIRRLEQELRTICKQQKCLTIIFVFSCMS